MYLVGTPAARQIQRVFIHVVGFQYGRSRSKSLELDVRYVDRYEYRFEFMLVCVCVCVWLVKGSVPRNSAKLSCRIIRTAYYF